MLSYRHAFHAGGPADVLKHAVFTACLERLTARPTPLDVLDTHAGAGAYDLTSPYAEKTGEWRRGLLPALRAADAPSLVARYLELHREVNPDGQVVTALGSPAIAARLLREGDTLDLVELHPTDHASLARRFGEHPGVRIDRADGYAALAGSLPGRGHQLILVDPSYELADEAEATVDTVTRARLRCPAATILVWYPVLRREAADAIVAGIANGTEAPVFRLELCTAPDGEHPGLTGSGVVLVNPPGDLPVQAGLALPWLATALAATGPRLARWEAGARPRRRPTFGRA